MIILLRLLAIRNYLPSFPGIYFYNFLLLVSICFDMISLDLLLFLLFFVLHGLG
jgi:hypothetical protein